MWTLSAANSPAVICQADATPPVSFAQAELRGYLGRILGATVAGDTPASADSPVIHLSTDAKSGLTDEGFELRVDGRTLRIIGGGDAGVVYGSYTFLREICSCQFSGLGPDSEYVPRRDRIEVTFGALRREPKLWYRGLQFSKTATEPVGLAHQRLDWMAKNGLNYVMMCPQSRGPRDEAVAERVEIDPRTGKPADVPGRASGPLTQAWVDRYLMPEIAKRGLKIDVNGHNLLFWLPPDRYMKDHPEWYAERDGVRGKETSQLCLCTSRPEAVATLVENVREYLRRHPQVKIVGVIPQDGYGMCQCRECVASDPDPRDAFRKPGDHRKPESENRSITRRYARLLNSVARGIREEFPDVLIGGAAYVDLQWPPRDVALEKNIVIWVALYWRDGARPLAAEGVSAYNRFFYDLLRQWHEAFAGRLIVYEYYMGMKAQRSLPYPMSKVICRDWPALRRLGVEGATVQCWSVNHQTYGLNLLAFARCGWEEQVVHEHVLDDYLLGMYDSVAGEVRPIYEGLIRALDELASCPPDAQAGPPEIPKAVLQPNGKNIAYFLRKVGARRMRESLESARAKARDDRERRQVEALARVARYWELAADAVEETAEVRVPRVIEYMRSLPVDGWVEPEAASRWE